MTKRNTNRPAKPISKRALMASAMGGAIIMTALPVDAQSARPSLEEMWAMMQAQQAKIAALETELAHAQVETVEVKAAVESVAVAVESTGGGLLGANSQIGGYGELHYEGGSKDKIDLHRFVLFFGHDFNDKLRFMSELEVEHAIAGAGKVGEVEIEQMFIEYDISDSAQIYGGVHLVPVGIMNETHEPPTFYGVERNAVEKNIIPATWWEGGIGGRGSIGESGFSYDVMASSGLRLNAGNGYKIRSGRQKVGKADMKSGAYSGRIQYSGIAGLTLASSLYYQPDVTQSVGDSVTGDNVSALLWTANMRAQYQGFGLNALYANWDLDGTDVSASGRDKQSGFYVEPSYKFDLALAGLEDSKFGVFYRYADWDNNGGLDNNTGVKRNVIGANFWPIDDVVLKLDYIMEDKDNSSETNKSLNAGIGYQF